MDIDDELLSQWEPKIQKMLSSIWLPGFEREDIAQELRIVIIKAARAAENELEKISAEILQAEIDLKNEQIELGFRSQEEVDARIKQLDILIAAEEEEEKQLKKNVKQYTGLGSAGANLSQSMNSTLAKLKEEKASLEGTEKAYLGLGESTQERIERLKEERELYIQFIDKINMC